MNNPLKIAKILSIFVDMTGLNKDKDATEMFKFQLASEVKAGNVSEEEQSIVLKLIGIEKAKTIRMENDPKFINIINIMELCISMHLPSSQIYSYINGEYKVRRIGANTRALLMQAFNVNYDDARLDGYNRQTSDVLFYTIEDLKGIECKVIIYRDSTKNPDTSWVFSSKTPEIDLMLRDRNILAQIKVDNYIVVTTTPGSSALKKLNIKISPEEIGQAEIMAKYHEKYNKKLWMDENIKNNHSVRVNMSKTRGMGLPEKEESMIKKLFKSILNV